MLGVGRSDEKRLSSTCVLKGHLVNHVSLPLEKEPSEGLYVVSEKGRNAIKSTSKYLCDRTLIVLTPKMNPHKKTFPHHGEYGNSPRWPCRRLVEETSRVCVLNNWDLFSCSKMIPSDVSSTLNWKENDGRTEIQQRLFGSPSGVILMSIIMLRILETFTRNVYGKLSKLPPIHVVYQPHHLELTRNKPNLPTVHDQLICKMRPDGFTHRMPPGDIDSSVTHGVYLGDFFSW